MERVEADLNKSKQVREKQSREFTKQLDEERNEHERKVVTVYQKVFFIFITPNLMKVCRHCQGDSSWTLPWPLTLWCQTAAYMGYTFFWNCWKHMIVKQNLGLLGIVFDNQDMQGHVSCINSQSQIKSSWIISYVRIIQMQAKCLKVCEMLLASTKS